MRFLFLENILSGELPGVVITLFLHSMWQGLILAVLAWISLRLTRKWSADARYNLLVLLLLSFAGCIIITFVNLWSKEPLAISQAANPVNPALAATVENISVLQYVVQWCNANASWIFLVWCVIFLVKADKMIRGLIAIDRLKQFGTTQAGSAWTKRFAELKAVLYIKKKVSLYESSLVNQPMVIGFFKPVVLVPIGLLSGLQPKEVEAILLHELAHIRRNDYLINLLQSFLETVFFFNPFFYWLSSMIRNEREHCCDALAIKHTGSKKTFIQALLSFHEQATPSPYAMGLMGSNSLLVERVNRIVSGKTNRISPLEKFIVAACYALLFVSLVSFSFINKKDKPQPEIVTNVVQPPRPNSPVSKPTINKDRRVDTIPPNASKEFLEGYKAGYNYRKQQSALADKKRKQIEAEFRKRTDSTITKTTQADLALTATATQNEANRKRKIEEALIAQKKDN